MTLIKDAYIVTQAEADTRSCGYLAIGDRDVLVYTTISGALRVKDIESDIITTVVESGVLWSYVANWDWSKPGRLIFFLTNSGISYYQITRMSDFRNVPLSFSLPSWPFNPKSFSMGYRSVDQLWVTVVDNGAVHQLYTSNTPNFSTCKTRVIWEVSLDPQLKVSQPSIGMHPGSDILTVAVDLYNARTKYKGVATYVTHLFKSEDEL